MTITVPKYRALSLSENEKIIGLLVDVNYNDNLCTIKNTNGEYICKLESLCIHINDTMFDESGKEIFASLNDCGGYGDIGCSDSFDNFEFIFRTEETIQYWDSFSFYNIKD